MDYAEVVIKITDFRDMGYCVPGIRLWFQDHGFDLKDFIKNGITGDKLMATNDELVIRVVRRKLGDE